MEQAAPVRRVVAPLRNRLALVSLFLAAGLLVAALLGLLYAVDPNYQNSAINAWPSAAHPLGTDSLGRDTLRILAGLRVSLIVVFYVELLNIGVGATLGLIAGFRGGAVDNVISRCRHAICLSRLLFAILVAAVFGAAVTERFGGGRLLLAAGSLALVSWPLMARYVRGQTRRSSSVTSCWRRAASAPTSDAFWEGTFCPAYWA